MSWTGKVHQQTPLISSKFIIRRFQYANSTSSFYKGMVLCTCAPVAIQSIYCTAISQAFMKQIRMTQDYESFLVKFWGKG